MADVKESDLAGRNDSDFGKLAIADQQPFVGIIYLKPGHIDPAFTIQSRSTLLNRVDEVKPPFMLIARHTEGSVRYRIRHY